MTFEYINSDRLSKLDPIVGKKASLLLDELERQGWDIVIAQGKRSTLEQDMMAARGSSAAYGDNSYHVWGLAIDLAIIRNKSADFNCTPIADIAKSFGFEWSGDWPSTPPFGKEYCHFQYTQGLSIQDLRNGARIVEEPVIVQTPQQRLQTMQRALRWTSGLRKSSLIRGIARLLRMIEG